MSYQKPELIDLSDAAMGYGNYTCGDGSAATYCGPNGMGASGMDGCQNGIGVWVT
jgi:hypothetical protein